MPFGWSTVRALRKGRKETRRFLPQRMRFYVGVTSFSIASVHERFFQAAPSQMYGASRSLRGRGRGGRGGVRPPFANVCAGNAAVSCPSRSLFSRTKWINRDWKQDTTLFSQGNPFSGARLASVLERCRLFLSEPNRSYRRRQCEHRVEHPAFFF